MHGFSINRPSIACLALVVLQYKTDCRLPPISQFAFVSIFLFEIILYLSVFFLFGGILLVFCFCDRSSAPRNPFETMLVQDSSYKPLGALETYQDPEIT